MFKQQILNIKYSVISREQTTLRGYGITLMTNQGLGNHLGFSPVQYLSLFNPVRWKKEHQSIINVIY